MCKFASFVLTKDREFWSETGDSHNDITRENNLTELKADAADYIYASGCNPNLKIKSRRGATIYR